MSAMGNRKRRSGAGWIAAGLLLIAAGLGLGCFNVLQSRRAGEASAAVAERLAPVTGVRGPVERKTAAPETAEEKTSSSETVPETPEDETEIPDHLLNPDMEMPVMTIDGEDYIGLLSLPELGLEFPIRADWSEEGLRRTPCRYSGSAYTGNLVICGHNYRTHFFNLRYLTMGSEVVFTDVDGNVFHYEAEELEQLAPTAVEEMTSGDWDLTLFTCSFGGTARLALRCRSVEEG